MKKFLLPVLLSLVISSAFAQQQIVLFAESFENPLTLTVNIDTTAINSNFGPNQYIINDDYSGGGIYPNTPDQNQTVGGSISYAPNSHYLHITDTTTMNSTGVANANYDPNVASEDFAYITSGFCTLGLTDVLFTFFYIGEGNNDAWLEVYYSADGGPWIQTGLPKYNNRSLWQYSIIQDPAFENVSTLRLGFRFVNTGGVSQTSIGFGIDDVIAVGTYDDVGNPTDLTITDIFPDTMCQLDPFVILWQLSGAMCEATYEVELSDGNGNFGNPQNLGVFNIGAGQVSGGVYIPSANIGPVPAGNCYKIRINRMAPPPLITGIASFCIVIEECPNSITTMQPPVTYGPDTLCVQSVIDVPFYSFGVFQPDNNYVALLSDSSGSFANPDTIGSSPDFTTYDPAINPNVPGMVSGLVPVVPDGCNYYIQIIGTDPVTYGTLYGPFCIHHCDIETNNTIDVHICVLDTNAVCDTLAADLDVYGQNVQYLNGNSFQMQLIDPMFYTIVNTGGLGVTYDTSINSFIICVPPLVDLQALGIAPGMYYARIVADSTNSPWNYLGSLIHLTIGAPFPDGPTIMPLDTTICQGDYAWMYIVPYNPKSTYEWVSNCLAGDDGQAGTPLTWPYNPLVVGFNPSNQSFDCQFSVREINYGCIGPWSKPVTIYALGPPNIDIQGPNPICVGDTAHYTVPFWPETYFTWTVDTTIATITNLANDEVYIVWNQPGNFYLKCYAANACGFTSTDSVLIKVLEPVDVDAGKDTSVCGLTPLDLQANLTGDVLVRTLATSFISNSPSNGTMFDVTATSDVVITSFEENFASSPVDVNIYYHTGTFVNTETTPSLWTLLGSTTGLTTNPAGQPTPVPIPLNVHIPAGQTDAFYITCTASTQNLRLVNGGVVGAILVQDAAMQIHVGVGNTFAFGQTVQPRKWTGKIHYTTTQGFTFNWNDGNVGAVDHIAPLSTMDYIVHVDDSIGCGGYDTVKVTVKPTPLTDAGPDTLTCNGKPVQLHGTSIGGDVYEWNYDASLSNPYIADPLATPPPGTIVYVLKSTDTSDGCYDYDTLFVSVGQNAVVLDSAGLCDGAPVTLTADETAQYYEWSNGETTQSIVVNAPGVYSVNITDSLNNCGVVDQFTVDQQDCLVDIYPPNAFSPNGDGLNDHFTIYGKDITGWELWIFNRWGQVVYHTTDINELNDPEKGWDGTFNGKAQNAGVFVYLIQAHGAADTPIQLKGNLTLLR